MSSKRKRAAGGSQAEVAVKAKRQTKLSSFLKVTGDGASSAEKTPLAELISEPGWRSELDDELLKPYFSKIAVFLEDEYKSGKEIFPPRKEIFNALNLTPLKKVKVVIIGQDPYHDVGQAHGLCFSVRRGVPPPPSLKNIYKELSADISSFKHPQHGCLEGWAEQGVLLLNATLTVEQVLQSFRAHKANSHSAIGWQTFTDAVIKTVSDKCDAGVVFILWGGFAQKKAKLVDEKRHHVIKAAHPSPLSVTKFLGCKCFSKTNESLTANGKEPVDWSL